jgi:hypothetical protein
VVQEIDPDSRDWKDLDVDEALFTIAGTDEILETAQGPML